VTKSTSHPRLSINGICNPATSLAEDLEFWSAEHFQYVGVPVAKMRSAGWERGINAMLEAGLRISNLGVANAFSLEHPDCWEQEQGELTRILDGAHRLSADCLFITPGSPGRMLTDESCDVFRGAIGPVLAHSQRVGVPLAVEHNHASRRDLGFVHSLREMIEYASEIGIMVCVELQNCWLERHLEQLFRTGVSTFALVQVSDYVIGDKCVPSRAVPGDGDIRLEQIIDWLLCAGYEGAFDVEILGPRIEAEGYYSAACRSMDWMSELLYKLGA
jgi:sugar phosphate isomerase/epimerase